MYFSSWLHTQLILIIISNFGDTIIPGKVAEKGQLPYMAYVKVRIDTSIIGECGGAILDETHIVTAAHCVDGYDMKTISVIVDKTLIAWEEKDEWEIINVIVHPKFKVGRNISDFAICWRSIIPFVPGPEDINYNKNDIAVLKLKKPLLLSERIKKIRIMDCDFLPYGDKCKFASWSLTNDVDMSVVQLKWTEFTILKSQICVDLAAFHRDNEFCAIDPEGKSAAVNGDSGSPLVCGDYLFGILSRSTCDPRLPAIFTYVFSHKQFISEALEN